MNHHAIPLPPVVEHGTGLVVMLDAAGRTITALEQRVDALTRALNAEREERAELARLLQEARNTCSIHPDETDSPDDGAHAPRN